MERMKTALYAHSEMDGYTADEKENVFDHIHNYAVLKLHRVYAGAPPVVPFPSVPAPTTRPSSIALRAYKNCSPNISR